VVVKGRCVLGGDLILSGRVHIATTSFIFLCKGLKGILLIVVKIGIHIVVGQVQDRLGPFLQANSGIRIIGLKVSREVGNSIPCSKDVIPRYKIKFLGKRKDILYDHF